MNGDNKREASWPDKEGACGLTCEEEEEESEECFCEQADCAECSEKGRVFPKVCIDMGKRPMMIGLEVVLADEEFASGEPDGVPFEDGGGEVDPAELEG
jgi:hypothetical protein